MKHISDWKLRFHSKYKRTESCWEWTGILKDNGKGQLYGIISIKKSGKWCSFYAHRIMWEISFGKIPTGLLVCHKCDNPKCVNPDHLFIGTHKDNSMDAARKGRCAMQVYPEKRPKGERNGGCKITKNIVYRIRNSYIPRKVTRVDIAKRFSISRSQVNRILAGTSWGHV